ncbi:predicted protein [Naegleria gruberi]|uniref:Predicted protein n=1 Tax=Naegleria gruberi TaxID=5762 RepID=D2W340_NAEGR|nr:uncharacterized protein NAEGRDRAFT_54340 [Naegleria gruberi]EFC36547.1 predicted protein [Naegleria gruberi]|eukprot:XP_002669291.1 predicted protein [Naegleria gruberi strain NEG-M]
MVNYYKHVIKLLVSHNAYVLKYAPSHWKDDRQVVELAIKHAPLAFQFCSERLRDDREIVLMACSKKYFSGFEFISERLKNDETIVKLAIESDGFNYSKIPEHLKTRKDIALLALSVYGYIFDYLPNELKRDIDIRIAACLSNGLNVGIFYPEIKDNKEIVLELAQHGKLNYLKAGVYKSLDLDIIEECVKSGISLSYLPSDLICERKDLLLIVLENHPYGHIKNTKHALDYDILLKAISGNSNHLKYVPVDLPFFDELVQVAMEKNLSLSCLPLEYPHYKQVAKTLIARNGSSIYYLEKSCFNDREILLSCLRVSDSSDHDFILSQVTDHQLWDDEEVIRAHLSSHPRHVFDEIERRISSNRSLILKMVPEFEVSIYELSEDLWNDKEVVMQVFNAIEYKKLPKHIRNDKEVLLAYIKYKPNEGTKFLNPELVKDLDFLKKVLKYSPNAYKFLTPELKLDRNLIFEIVENNPCLFKFLDSSFRNDRELIMMIVKKYGTDHLDVIPESLRADKELIWSSVEKSADFFNKYPSTITDRELLLHAVKHYPYTLQYADPPLCDDFEVIMTACKNSGMALKFASPRLKSNPDIVKAAILSYEYAFSDASPFLKEDFMFCISALLCNHSSIHFVNDERITHSFLFKILFKVEIDSSLVKRYCI